MSIMQKYGGGKYLKAVDIEEGQKVIIRELREEMVGASMEDKPVLFFEGLEKGLILNKTNARALVGVLGDNEETWPGAKVNLTIIQVNNPSTGEMVDSVRCVAQPKKKAATSTATAFDDAIPF
jgi:predicted DNA-binding antitoxin AbrB/MazE fold protein